MNNQQLREYSEQKHCFVIRDGSIWRGYRAINSVHLFSTNGNNSCEAELNKVADYSADVLQEMTTEQRDLFLADALGIQNA